MRFVRFRDARFQFRTSNEVHFRPDTIMIVRKSLIRAFGRNVKGRRKRRKWVQAELARRADLKAATIGKIERGATNARLSTVESIARAFQIEPAELLNRLSAKSKTLDRQEMAFRAEGWEDVTMAIP